MNRNWPIIFVLVMLISCQRDFTPKPRGYYRIDLPAQKSYLSLASGKPYTFEYSKYAHVKNVASNSDSFWIDIIYPELNGKIHLSYKPLRNKNLNLYVEDAHKFVFKHAVMASSIDESTINDSQRKMYGVLYDIGGDAASNTQFYITDSANHFLRAALYFKCPPDRDSLDPVIAFVNEDIMHLLETFKWAE